MSADAKARVPSMPWLLGMSSWMLLTLVPGAATTWLGFALVGIVARKPRVLVLSAVFAGAAIVASLSVWGQWRPVAGAVVYLAGMLVALGVNPGWLRAMWERRSARAQRTSSPYGPAQPAPRPRPTRRPAAQKKRPGGQEPAGRRKKAPTAAAASAAAATAEDASLAASLGARSDDLIAPTPTPTEAPAEPVDVNTADVDALATLPGISRSRARKGVRVRDDQGGFVSVEAFGEAVGLQPHEIVRLRTLAICSPRPRGERRFGRRVDL